jgi:hypothetical protein
MRDFQYFHIILLSPTRSIEHHTLNRENIWEQVGLRFKQNNH